MLYHTENPFRRMVVLGLFFLLSSLATIPQSNAGNPGAAAVKAALVLNFAKFTTWPEDAFSEPAAPIDLWVYGDAAIQAAFGDIDGQVVGSRKIRIRLMKAVETTDNCHMMFFDQDTDRDILAAALRSVEHRPVLMTGAIQDFIHMGGMINMISINGRYYFEINPGAANMRGLKISSRFLKLAIIVDE